MDKIRIFPKPIINSKSKILSGKPLFFQCEIISNEFKARGRDEIDPLTWEGNVAESRASKDENACFVATRIVHVRTRNCTSKKKAC